VGNQLSRRQFLRTATTGLGATAIAPRLAFGHVDPPALPKATLVLAGGSLSPTEDICEQLRTAPQTLKPNQYDPTGMFREVMPLAKQEGLRVECITSAAADAVHYGQEMVAMFKLLGAKQADYMLINNEQDADNPDYVERLKKADFIFLGGGNQFLYTKHMQGDKHGSKLLTALRERHRDGEGVVIMGTSAGAMIMSEYMIDGGDKDDVVERMKPGFGLTKTIIDTHFSIRPWRIDRLRAVVKEHPQRTGIGLEDCTALVIAKGQSHVIGKGNAYVVSMRPDRGEEFRELSWNANTPVMDWLEYTRQALESAIGTSPGRN
jgi:cyanophycinase